MDQPGQSLQLCPPYQLLTWDLEYITHCLVSDSSLHISIQYRRSFQNFLAFGMSTKRWVSYKLNCFPLYDGPIYVVKDFWLTACVLFVMFYNASINGAINEWVDIFLLFRRKSLLKPGLGNAKASILMIMAIFVLNSNIGFSAKLLTY